MDERKDNDLTVLSTHDESTVLSNHDESTVLSAFSGGSRSGSPSSASSSGAWGADARKLEAGQTFGPYAIVRLLGRGGMGEVYEAVHAENGRRVALKLLRGRMDEREDRARFLSEGRLAASISHPHTVYIFGSEEIDGLPVIAMQLLPGGTLKDRVVEKGPMPTADAVAAILDVIGGLDAAASAGILHRDIKPSNCFVDTDGSVKVGDFGLSISTSTREAGKRHHGFQGTPAYAPPEQLRGEPLDVRADIYAVGATLCYLLTGKAPFEGKDFQELIQRVKESPAPLVHKLAPGVPPALGALIARCLAKDAAGRPSSYAELAHALRPFSGLAAPARRTTRLVAGMIDFMLVSMGAALLRGMTSTGPNIRINANANISVDPWPLIVGLVYFGVSETLWAATLGKRLIGLRVASTSGVLSWRQTMARAFIFEVPQMPVLFLAWVFGRQALATYLSAHDPVTVVVGMLPLGLGLALFATMRRTNGFAAIHDLVTHTRVVQRRVVLFRSAATGDRGGEVAERASSGGGERRLGTFEVGRKLGDVAGGQLFEAVDTVLRRPVWLIEAAPGAPDVSRARRDIDRVGRLHWLAGVRSDAENWDAFEAPAGAPLDPAEGAAPWSSVRGWLGDLVAELAAGERDQTTPELSLDRVWIRHDGRAVVLDFPAPGRNDTGSRFPESGKTTPGVVLSAIGRLARRGHAPGAMPASALPMFDRWARKSGLTIADVEADLVTASMAPDQVSRGRRLLPLLLSAAPVIFMMIAAILATGALRRVASGEMLTAVGLLSEIDRETDPARRAALETYVAGTFHAQMSDNGVWQYLDDKDDARAVARMREIAQRVAARQPSPAEIAAAEAIAQTTIDRVRNRNGGTSATITFVALLLVGAGMSFFPGLVSVLMRRSGLVLATLGLAVVARSGREVSRAHAVLRLTVAWSPLLLYAVLVAVPSTRPWATASVIPGLVALGLVTLGAIWTILRPLRGPHDLLVRTHIGVR